MTRHLSYNLLNALSRLLNFGLFWIIVNKLGASGETDWFFFVYGFVYFCISTAFFSLEFALVPTWPGLSEREKKGFLQACIVLGIFCSILLQFLGLAVSLYLPGFFGFNIPFSKGHIVLLSIILFLQPSLAYFSALYSSLLQSSRQYFWPITHLSWRTLGVLPIFILPFCSGVTCLSIAYIIGEIVRFLSLMSAARRRGIRFSIPQRFKLSPYRQHFVAIGWMALTIIASAFNPYIDLIMVGQLGDGNATLVEYAGRLRGLPVLLLSGTLVVLLGDWSARQDKDLLREQIKGYAWKMGLCGLMIAGGLIFARHYWMPLIFRAQQFNSLQLGALDSLMIWYLIGAPFMLVIAPLGRGFMVMRKFSLLAVVAVISIIANVILNFTFIKMFGIKGVAISTTVLDGLQLCAYFYIMKKFTKSKMTPLQNPSDGA